MSIDQLTAEAMALPIDDRVVLAHTLMGSIEDREELEIDPEYMGEILRRCEELDSGKVQAIPHEEVMAAARRILECD